MLVNLLRSVMGISNLDESTECFVSFDGILRVALPGYCDEEYLCNGKYMTVKELENGITVYFENKFGDHEALISARCMELEDYGVVSFYAASSNGYATAKKKYEEYYSWNAMI